MIKLKSLIKEDVAEFNNVTKSLQTCLTNFNTSATNTYGKGNIWLLKVEAEHYSRDDASPIMPSGRLMYQTFTWTIYLTNPKTGSTISKSNVGRSTPVVFGQFKLVREGAENAYGSIIFIKQFKIQNSADITPDASKLITVCNYNGNVAAPTWADTNSALANLSNGFKTMATKAYDTESDRGNEKYTGDKTQFLKTSQALLTEGPSLIQDIKSVFNQIEIGPINPEAKKTWKGMKKV
jgi:hypothetical protein